MQYVAFIYSWMLLKGKHLLTVPNFTGTVWVAKAHLEAANSQPHAVDLQTSERLNKVC